MRDESDLAPSPTVAPASRRPGADGTSAGMLQFRRGREAPTALIRNRTRPRTQAGFQPAIGPARCRRYVPLVEAPRPRGSSRSGSADGGPIPLEELHDIAEESSQSERRADEAERELMEWKKVKFMQDRVGEDFDGLIISVTKYGFFVELTDLFVEGLVPLDTLTDDRYTYHENTREIIGQRSRKIYSLGQRVRVLVDRIDPVEKKIQFALFEEKPAPEAQESLRLV